jgi:signal transduction histidine kinase
MDKAPEQQDYQTVIRSWENRAPLLRRLSARMGLQGKLVISFLVLLAGALGGSCWLLLHQSRAILDHICAEHAEQICWTAGLASRAPFERGSANELNRIAAALLKHQEILAIGFFNPSGKLLAAAKRDNRFTGADAALWVDPTDEPSLLGQPSFGQMSGFGRYVLITNPVLGAEFSPRARPGASHVVGYVMICLAQTDAQAAVREVEFSLISLNATVLLLSLPLVLALVHRIFDPIRQLLSATHRIIEGDFAAAVAIHRPDAIGALARAFNEMVGRVRSQQQQLTDANQKLADVNQELENKVRLRTAELLSANQRLSSEMAEKEEFLRAVSHDLGAPLRNIAGMASMLLMKKRNEFDDEVVHRLERIQKNVEVETNLISELLELSQIKSRRGRLETVSIHQLMRDLADIFEEDLRSRQIALVLDMRLPDVRCERNRMRQVFQNLLDNAIKYMGAATVREIHVGWRLMPGAAEFYVRDTGMGIDPGDLGKVFQVFRRGRGSVVDDIPGKGVGLASVKSIVETYDGQIRVESRVGQGSIFRFTFHARFLAGPESKVIGRAAKDIAHINVP